MLLRSLEAFHRAEKIVIGNLSVLMFVAASVIVIFEVVNRYVFNSSFMWAGETVTYLTACGAFLYFGLTEEGTGHLRTTLLLQGLRNSRLKKPVDLVAFLMGMVYCVLCAWLAVRMASMFYRNKVVSLNAELPMWIFYAALFAGFVFLFVRLLTKLIVTIKTPNHRTRPSAEGGPA